MTCVVIHPDDQHILSSSQDGTIRNWRIGTPGPQARFTIALPRTSEQVSKEAERVMKTKHEVEIALNESRPRLCTNKD